MLEWRGGGLPLSAGMGCADAFTCPCGRPKIHGDRTSVAYSTVNFKCVFNRKLNVHVHLHGNAGLLSECSIGNCSRDGSSLRLKLLLVCHSSYGPTINGRLLADRTKLYTPG